MRLLIGSDGPASLGRQADVRAWTQRLLWFAEAGDAIVLMDDPDPVFVRHVTELTGVSESTLRFHVMPSRWTGGNFDAWSLLEPRFQDSLLEDAAAATEVVALWPCAEVGWLVRSLEIEHKLPGAAFWREGGGAIANSKALFRALAASAGVDAPLGGVCRSPEDAFRLSGHLLEEGHAFMVKRSFGGGGRGNEVVSTNPLSLSHAGHASAELLEYTAQSLHAYWDRRWQWASADGEHPVVVEAFVPDARTLYAEVECRADGVNDGKIGELKFERGEIALEIFPAQDVSPIVRAKLLRQAGSLAQLYWLIGYRGFLSLDSVVTPDGQVLLTEANARFTGSTHLYNQIAGRVARLGDPVEGVVVQMVSHPSFRVQNLGELLDTLSAEGLTLAPGSRRGVLLVTPVVHGNGQVVFGAVADTEAAAVELIHSAQRTHGRTSRGD